MNEHDWKRLALHALEDLRVLGVPIEKIHGVDDDVLAQVDHYSRESTSYT